MVQSISNFFSMILNWLYSVVPNYPVDIILMTFAQADFGTPYLPSAAYQLRYQPYPG